VGIGQSEADISFVADTLLLCIQPGSGDSLQFMKAGIMELPDIVAVTKADLGDPARRAKADVEGALGLVAVAGRPIPVVLVAAAQNLGLEALDEAIAQHRVWLAEGDRLARRRAVQESVWVEEAIRSRFGSVGLKAARPIMPGAGGPFSAERTLSRELRARLSQAAPSS